MELSPPAVRSLLVGLTYQLGNLASSASATIQATIGEKFPLPPSATEPNRFDYAKVIGIFMGAVWVFDVVVLFIGPEMSQEERDEEAAAGLQLEKLTKGGMSLSEVGEASGALKEERELEAQRLKSNVSGKEMEGEKEAEVSGERV